MSCPTPVVLRVASAGEGRCGLGALASRRDTSGGTRCSERICSGALNLRLRPQDFAGQEGLVRLSQVLRGYLDLGGLQVQLSFADSETLREAQHRPEAYRDLMVRITGYSACFVDMTRTAQDEIIRREEMGT